MSKEDPKGDGQINPGFQGDSFVPRDTVLPMTDIVDTRVVVGAEDRSSLGDGQTANGGPAGAEEGRPQRQQEEEEEEDYGILTLLPFYPWLKKRVRAGTEGVNTGLWIKRLVLAVIAALYFCYFVAVLAIHTTAEEGRYWCDGDGLLIIITFLVLVGLFYFQILKPYFGRTIYKKVLKPIGILFEKAWRFRVLRLGVYVGLLLIVFLFLLVDAWHETHRLISLFGLFVLLFLGFIFSKAPRKVRWRHVAWGMGLQFLLGIIILRWPVGKAVFECAGDKVSAFLAFTDKGSGFVFGDLVTKQFVFAFKVLSVILFFSFCIQILYYWGVMQWVVIKLGWVLQVTVGTTACESVNAAANIFLGQTEAPLLIKPYLSLMTESELHAVMTGGFATIAGSVLAAYISFGVDPAHLLSASVMSAPAALAFSKLFYPETKVSRTGVKDIKIEKGEETNWLHAAMIGVTNAIPLVANIAANLIAFYAFIAFCNGVFDWTCTLAGAAEGTCSLESLFGWIFMPLAWVMGVDWAECEKVGELIGIKSIANEFLAYQRLSEMKKNGDLSKRAEIIATYALCGFSNLSSIGINLGGFSAMAPDRKADLAKVVVRAMIAGSAACFLTACVAGTLLSDDAYGGAAAAINGTQAAFT